MKRIGVFTSGGDSPGMNACIRAVVRAACHYDLETIGIYRGYQGMIENDMKPLSTQNVRYIIDKGGTMLYSARCKEFRTKEGRQQAYENLKNQGIEALVAIGGDGTFTGAQIFSSEFDIPVIGIPGTIDNDIAGTEVTLGYDTASNTAMEAIDKIRDTSTSHNRLFLVEVMGRHAGDIALRCGLAAGAIATFIPEQQGEFDKLLASLDRAKKRKKRSNIIVVAEGEESGGAIELAAAISEKLPEYETRVTILGHLQRGGSPTVFDRNLAAVMGIKAVEALKDGYKNQMTAIVNNRIELVPLEKAVTEKSTIDPEKLRMLEILSF